MSFFIDGSQCEVPIADSVQYPGCSYLNRINLYLYQSLFCFPFDDTHPENLGYD